MPCPHPIRLLIPLAVLISTLAATSALVAAPLGSPNQGRELAREVCTACHSVEKGETGKPLAGAPAFQDIVSDPAVTETALRVFFQTPHDSMPNLILTESETDNLVAYLLSLR